MPSFIVARIFWMYLFNYTKSFINILCCELGGNTNCIRIVYANSLKLHWMYTRIVSRLLSFKHINNHMVDNSADSVETAVSLTVYPWLSLVNRQSSQKKRSTNTQCVLKKCVRGLFCVSMWRLSIALGFFSTASSHTIKIIFN